LLVLALRKSLAAPILEAGASVDDEMLNNGYFFYHGKTLAKHGNQDCLQRL